MAAKMVNNDVYHRLAHGWWDDDVGEFSTIRFFVNPVRFAYFERVLQREAPPERATGTLLDVGCGGGILSEDFARTGLRVTGIDPVPDSLDAARAHAAVSDLTIDYRAASGEHLPFPDTSFDFAACCDVLEHVDDVDRVIGEIARVLRPGGLFFYDTINRTFRSKLAVIKVMQEWKATAFAEPNSHVWERFITPAELTRTLERHGFEQREMRGISVGSSPLATLLAFRRRVQGRISFREMGQHLAFHESEDLSVSYMGYAVKRT